jgi:FkbM family methyltransferase
MSYKSQRIKLGIKLKLRKILPNFAMEVFRKCRKIKRQHFYHLSDYKLTKKYERMISQKFPKLENSNKGQSHGKVLDLGANIGHFTSACVNLGYEVIAVEPHPGALKYLRRRVGKSESVKIIPTAVGASKGFVELNFHPDHLKDPLATSISASIIPDKFSTNSVSVTVPTVPLFEFFRDGTTYEMVKIDIEGAEMFLVPDLIKYSSQIKRLLVETHDRFMQTSEDGLTYARNLENLRDFIEENDLTKVWHTDWI